MLIIIDHIIDLFRMILSKPLSQMCHTWFEPIAAGLSSGEYSLRLDGHGERHADVHCRATH